MLLLVMMKLTTACTEEEHAETSRRFKGRHTRSVEHSCSTSTVYSYSFRSRQLAFSVCDEPELQLQEHYYWSKRIFLSALLTANPQSRLGAAAPHS